MTDFSSIKAAQALVFNRKSNLGTLIKDVTGMPYTHCAIYEGAHHSEVYTTIEAHDLEGVRHCVVGDDYFADPTVLTIAAYDIPTLTDDERWAILDYADGMNGWPYDTEQLIGILCHRRIPGMTLNQNSLDDPKKLICSELVGRAYIGGAHRMGILPDGVCVGCLTPADLTTTLTWTHEWYRGPGGVWVAATTKEEVPREEIHPFVPSAPDPPDSGH